MIIISDDITGAADCGVKFVEEGLSTEIILNSEYNSKAEVKIFCTESRGISLEEAKHAVSEVVQNSNCEFIFKKIDSTLRGHIGGELETVLEESQADVIFLCSAFPELGRTVKKGICFLKDQEIHKTDLAKDPLNPIIHSRITDVIALESSLPVTEVSPGICIEEIYELNEKATQIFSFDAVTSDELSQIVKLAKRCTLKVILAGSSGLGKALAQDIKLYRKCNIELMQDLPLLFVSGSVRPSTLEQLQVLINENLISHRNSVEDTIADLKQNNSVLLTTCLNEKDIQHWTTNLLCELAQIVSQVISTIDCRLVVIGGQTSQAIIKVSSARAIVLREEFEPGIPVSELIINQQKRIPMLTKSGNFGDAYTLARIHLNYSWIVE